MKKLFSTFLLVTLCLMSTMSVFAADHSLQVEKPQEKISMQEYYNLFDSGRTIQSDTVSEVTKISDTEFSFRFYAEDLLGKPKTGEHYFEVYSPYVGDSMEYETYLDGLLYRGTLHRGRIAETVNGEYRYWYAGWLTGYDPDSGFAPYSN